MKDNFSGHSSEYAKYRPSYPKQLYDFIRDNCHNFDRAWDCGCGNGQVTGELARIFKEVEATDISSNQISQAKAAENVKFSVISAENAEFPEDLFDLIISAQAVHWFNFPKFYKNVQRSLKPNGLFIATGYGLIRVNSEIDEIIDHFYENIIGNYWDEERNYVETHYQNIPFPFSEINAPGLEQRYSWTASEMLGYLRTWSSVKHFEKHKHEDPVQLVENQLIAKWGKARVVKFPIFIRAGRLQ